MKGAHQLGEPSPGAISSRSPAPKLCTDFTAPDRLARRRADGQADQVGEVVLVLLGLGQAGAVDVEPQAAQGLGLFAGRDLARPGDQAPPLATRPAGQGQGGAPSSRFSIA